MSQTEANDVIPRLDLAELRPYVSLLLAKSSEADAGKQLFADVLNGCAKVIFVDDARRRRAPAAEPKFDDAGAVQFGAMLIDDVVRPGWTSQPDIQDQRYHVLIVARLGNFFAFHSDDNSIRDAIANNFGEKTVDGLRNLSAIENGIMNAAFVQGTKRTVWLRGIHHPTSLKSDTKTLSGLDLDDALSPLDDQSYHFTAVRSHIDDGETETTIGAAPPESRIWVGPSRNWEAYKAATITMLTRLAETHNPSDAPIRYLAIPGLGGVDIQNAFDLVLYPPELIDGAPVDAPDLANRIRIASEVSFAVTPQNGADLTAIVNRKGERIGSLSLHFDIQGSGAICNAAVVADAAQYTDDLTRIQGYCEYGNILLVRYDSEHVISGRTVYRNRYRDHAFSGYEWEDLQDWKILEEKPSTLARIGEETSLFCWVWWKWSGLLNDGFGGGWLACDDGAGEKADFIHIDDAGKILSLIHVKASDSDSDNRSVAVGAYEIVVSQAIKNLRYLDRDNLKDGLAARVNGGGAMQTWHAGTPNDRAAFLNAILQIDAKWRRRIVIVQPHLTEGIWQRASQNPESQEGRRLRQLNTLLLSADTSCRALTSSLAVVGAR
ncbi:MAG TPA: hypothetical protein VF006_01330 [Longimicrobium sp.]